MINFRFRPARSLEAQISIDDRRRSELMSTLRDKDSREDLLGLWMDLIDEKNETEFLTIVKFRMTKKRSLILIVYLG